MVVRSPTIENGHSEISKVLSEQRFVRIRIKIEEEGSD